RHLPTATRDWLRRVWRGSAYTPPRGCVRLGDLRRTTPLSRDRGRGRGLPVDLHYVEQFLCRHASDIRGHVLEVGDDVYTRKFGGLTVMSSGVLSQTQGPRTTIIADLTRPDLVPAGRFDCVIIVQILQFAADLKAAVRTLH